MDYLLFLLVGVVLGILISKILYNTQKPDGVLMIDHSNPEKDIYRFNIENLDDLQNKTLIIVKVDNNADLSQK